MTQHSLSREVLSTQARDRFLFNDYRTGAWAKDAATVGSDSRSDHRRVGFYDLTPREQRRSTARQRTTMIVAHLAGRHIPSLDPSTSPVLPCSAARLSRLLRANCELVEICGIVPAASNDWVHHMGSYRVLNGIGPKLQRDLDRQGSPDRTCRGSAL